MKKIILLTANIANNCIPSCIPAIP